MLKVTLNIRALRAVLVAVSTEETRYYLNGINLEFTPDGVIMAATDGHRMIVLRQAYGEHAATAAQPRPNRAASTTHPAAVRAVSPASASVQASRGTPQAVTGGQSVSAFGVAASGGTHADCAAQSPAGAASRHARAAAS